VSDTYTYHITRNCLKSGRMFLSPSARELFPREGSVEVTDAHSGETVELTLMNALTVGGLGPLYKRYSLEPNDLLLIRREGEAYTLTPTARPRHADYTRADVQRTFVDRVVEQAPLSEREIRALFSDLPADFDVARVLRQDGRLSKYEGRWQFVTEAPAEIPASSGTSSRRATVTTYAARPAEDGPDHSGAAAPSDGSLHTKLRGALETFGFRLEPRSYMQLLAHAELGRRHYSVLVQLLGDGARLDWTKLLARRRELGVTYLAVFGAHHDLLRLQAPAVQARATLWSWAGVERALDLVGAVPMSPFDLEPHFARDGLFEEGLRRFERTVEKRVDSRGNFSSVLQRLVALRAPSVFLLEDVMIDSEMSRDQVLGILNLLSEAPFHLVSRVDSGEFCLRQGVHENLTQVSHYALSLTERLPARHTERVRGNVAAQVDAADVLA